MTFLQKIIISGLKVADSGFQPSLSASTLIDQQYILFQLMQYRRYTREETQDLHLHCNNFSKWRNIDERVMMITDKNYVHQVR